MREFPPDLFESTEFPPYAGIYEFVGNKLIIDDPVWGREVIGDAEGDEVLIALLHNPLVRRSMAIEQLSLDEAVATVPNTGNFARWEHIWGSVVSVRKLTEGTGISARDRMILQLRTFVSDLAHTVFSHIGDFISQGYGGTESQHDNDLPYLLRVSGIVDIIERYGYTAREIIDAQPPDWVERPSPDLCVDRVDYTARESIRWLDFDDGVRRAMRADSFKLIDGQIVMRNKQLALSFFKAHLLLGTENWSEPAHRVNLWFQAERVKRIITGSWARLNSLNPLDSGDYHPRSLMYSIDSDIDHELHFSDFGAAVGGLMREIATAKKSIFTSARAGELAVFLATDTAEYPDPLRHYGPSAERLGERALLPSNLEVVIAENGQRIPSAEDNLNTIELFLPALKLRQIDPLYLDENDRVVRLSETDNNVPKLLAAHAEIMRRNYIARIFVKPELKLLIESEVAENEIEWQQAILRPPMPEPVLRDMLRNTVITAAVHRLINLKWND